MSRLEYFFHLNPQLFLTFRLKISEKNLHMKQIETFYKYVYFSRRNYTENIWRIGDETSICSGRPSGSRTWIFLQGKT